MAHIICWQQRVKLCYCAAWTRNFKTNVKNGSHFKDMKDIILIFQYLVQYSMLIKISRHCSVKFSIFWFVIPIFCHYRYVNSRTLGHFGKWFFMESLLLILPLSLVHVLFAKSLLQHYSAVYPVKNYGFLKSFNFYISVVHDLQLIHNKVLQLLWARYVLWKYLVLNQMKMFFLNEWTLVHHKSSD